MQITIFEVQIALYQVIIFDTFRELNLILYSVNVDTNRIKSIILGVEK